MKLVVEQYAKALIAIMVAVVLVSTIMGAINSNESGVGIFLGNAIEAHFMDKEKISTGFVNYKDKIAPTIYFYADNQVIAGKAYDTSAFFSGFDSQNKKLSVSIIDCFDDTFQLANYFLSADRRTFSIANPGVYWLLVTTTDANNVCTQNLIKLFVNEVAV